MPQQLNFPEHLESLIHIAHRIGDVLDGHTPPIVLLVLSDDNLPKAATTDHFLDVIIASDFIPRVR